MNRSPLRLVRVSLLTGILAAASHSGLAQSWTTITSDDGRITASAPGSAEKSVVTTRTPAGKVVTNVSRHQTDNVIFDLSSTALKPGIVKFAGKDRIIQNARGETLSRTMGREISFESITVSGVPAKLLKYSTKNLENPSGPGYLGLSLILMHENTLYVCNALVKEEAGMADIEKFGDSIRIR